VDGIRLEQVDASSSVCLDGIVGIRSVGACDVISRVPRVLVGRALVGVQMRVDGLYQLEFELAHELQIAVDLGHRIDDQRLAAMPAGNEIGVGAGKAVEELAEYLGDSIPRILRRTPQDSVRRRARVRRL
jgi:hypothetical protein